MKLTDEQKDKLVEVLSESISDKDVSDVLCSAFEHGISYWASKVTVDEWPEGAEYASDVPSLGGTVTIEDPYDDPDSPKRYTLDADKARKGIVLAALHIGKLPDAIIEGDCLTADLAVQCAIFGEAIYG